MTRWQGRPDGLGVIITQLSFYLSCGPAEVVVSNQNNILFDIKRIWQIPDDQLKITIGDGVDAIANIESDELCTYAPYLSRETISLYGKEFQVGKKNKPCVALCMHHGGGLGEDLEIKSMPYNKYATLPEYQEIWQKLYRLGYDVIVINRRDISVEQKIYLLNELCEFVIGYEGGIQHLAHCLKIPCIVLPWQYNDAGGEPAYPGMYYEPHRFHADRKTYFLNKIDDFLQMTNAQIDRLILDLHANRGNNILFTPGVTLNPKTLEITYRESGIEFDLTPRICWCHTHGDQTVKIIKENLSLENMIRYPVDQITI